MFNPKPKINQRICNQRARVAVVVALSLAAFAAVGGQSSADVATVSGSAFGASGTAQFTGQPPVVLPPTATVLLPPTGSPTLTATAPSATIDVGTTPPLFQSGQLTVNTQGSIGPSGSSTTNASLANPSIGDNLTMTSLSSTCSASEAGLTGSTTVTGGRVTPGVGAPFDVPTMPAVNQSYTVTVVGTNYFTVVFNEQVVTADSITVNAAHIQFFGFVTGDLILGQVHCDFTAAPVTTTLPPVTTTAPPVTTTVPPVTTTAPPVTTTAPPVTTTAPPVTTTAPPVTTTAPPVTTTAPPVTTTAPPVSTTVVRALPVLSLGTDPVPVAEPSGSGRVSPVFIIALSAPPTSPVTVHYATADGTAVAGADYEASSGDVTFDPGGSLDKFVPVAVFGDSVAEPDETFTLTLSNPVGALLGQRSAAVATIVDTPPAVPFAYECVAPTDITTASATLHAATTDPGVTGASFTVSRDGTAVGSPIAVPGVGPFSAAVTGLDPATTYTYTATFDPGAVPQSNAACSFTTAPRQVLPPPAPSPTPPIPAPGPAAVPLVPQAPSASPTFDGPSGTSGGTASSPSAGGVVARSPLARTGALITSQVGTALLLVIVGGLFVIGARQRSIRRSRSRRSQP